MASVERVTVTLPNHLVRDIDRREKNRSKFVAEAVRHELDRRRRAELRRSLQNPHSESAELAEQGDKLRRGKFPRLLAKDSRRRTRGGPTRPTVGADRSHSGRALGHLVSLRGRWRVRPRILSDKADHRAASRKRKREQKLAA